MPQTGFSKTSLRQCQSVWGRAVRSFISISTFLFPRTFAGLAFFPLIETTSVAAVSAGQIAGFDSAAPFAFPAICFSYSLAKKASLAAFSATTAAFFSSPLTAPFTSPTGFGSRSVSAVSAAGAFVRGGALASVAGLAGGFLVFPAIAVASFAFHLFDHGAVALAFFAGIVCHGFGGRRGWL
ncbi:MAG: hypothetical protein ACKVUS_01750 [Saprospiraceae bacterium]